MDINQIRLLLAKYFEGTTTLEEEQTLQTYFTTTGDIPDELVSYKQQFVLLNDLAAGKAIPETLKQKIAEKIDSLVLDAKPASQKPLFSLWRIAASIAILIAISGVIFYQSQKSETKDTYTDPQLAYQEVQKTLLYVSQKINTGIEPLSNVEKISTGTRNLKSLEKMDESLGMLNLVSFINKSSNMKK
jgi:hypothetical protein